MKKLILGLLVTVCVQNVFAEARDFRLFSDGVAGPVALAWGVKGAKIDFEHYDSKSRDEQWAFFGQNAKDIENYLIDVKTMKVLAVLREAHESNAEAPQGPIIELSEKINTNHNDIYVKFDEPKNLVMVTSYAKWWGGASTLIILRQNKLGQNEVAAECDNCEETVIVPALKSRMTKKQIKDFEETGSQSMHYELTVDSNGQSVWKVTAYSQTKMESVAFEGFMRLTYENGKFKAVFGKVKQIE